MGALPTSEPAGLRFAPYIEELREFFTTFGLRYGSPADIEPMTARLRASETFFDDLSSLLRSIILREGGAVPHAQLLEILALAIGGPAMEQAPQQYSASLRQLLLFVTTILRRPWNVPPGEVVPFPAEGSNPAAEAAEQDAPPTDEISAASEQALLEIAEPTAQRREEFDLQPMAETVEPPAAAKVRHIPMDVPIYSRVMPDREPIAPVENPAQNPVENPTQNTADDMLVPEPEIGASPVRTPPSVLSATPQRATPLSRERRKAWTLVAALAMVAVAAFGIALTMRPHPAPEAAAAPATTTPSASAPAQPTSAPTQPNSGPVQPSDDASKPSAYGPAVASESRPTTRSAYPASRGADDADEEADVATPTVVNAPGWPPRRAAAPDAAANQASGQPSSSQTRTVPAPVERRTPISPETQQAAPATAYRDADASLAGDPLPVRPLSPDPRFVRQPSLRVSSGVMAANLLSDPAPEYPAMARLAHIQGQVILQAVVARDGTVSATRVLSGHRLLRGAAVDAVRRWRYRPYLVGGHPVDVDTIVTVDFRR